MTIQPPDLMPCRDERDVLADVLTGGNHLASALTATCLPNDVGSYDEALRRFGQPYADMWIAWRYIMCARPYLRSTRPQPNIALLVQVREALEIAIEWRSLDYVVSLLDEDAAKCPVWVALKATKAELKKMGVE